MEWFLLMIKSINCLFLSAGIILWWVTLYESWIVLTDSRETSLLKPPRP
jgi:hypothetical protein